MSSQAKNFREGVRKSVDGIPVVEEIDLGRVLSILSVILGFFIWQTGTQSTPSILIPAPTSVVTDWIALITTGELTAALISSFQHMFLGYAIAAVTAIPLGFAMGRSKIVHWAVNPYIDAVYATPTVAYIPLIIVWFGLGFPARVFLVFLFCFFEMLIDTQQGIRSINEDYLDVGESFDLSWWDRQRKVLLPASLPYVFTGLRIGVGRAVRGMIVAELFLAVVNLGLILETAAGQLDTARQLAVIITISLTGLVFQNLVMRLEQLAIPWHFDSGGEH
jgi:ABC-type nitrate/sulfonate/bicarbonate transport system permease component